VSAIYTRDHLIRDVAYFFHMCAMYHGLPTDGILYSLVLNGPYYAFFEGDDPGDPEDQLIREGSLLIFLGMLDDWDAGASFYFDEISRGGYARLSQYLPALLQAYQHARELNDVRIVTLCEEALALLAGIELSGRWSRELEDVDPKLWAQVRQVTLDQGLTPPVARLAQRDLYEEYVSKYFHERCK
jgi:hypothetical protein